MVVGAGVEVGSPDVATFLFVASDAIRFVFNVSGAQRKTPPDADDYGHKKPDGHDADNEPPHEGEFGTKTASDFNF